MSDLLYYELLVWWNLFKSKLNLIDPDVIKPDMIKFSITWMLQCNMSIYSVKFAVNSESTWTNHMHVGNVTIGPLRINLNLIERVIKSYFCVVKLTCK